MTRDEIRRAVQRFRVSRARQTVVKIWEAARWMDTQATWRAAKTAERCLREAGIEDVRVEQMPSDGKTSVNGWIMPIAWDMEEARLEAITEDGPNDVLADYRMNPQSIAVYSPGTRRGNWVEGPVVESKNPMRLGEQLRGCFLLLPEGNGSFDINERAARHGALAVLTISDSPYPDAAKYLNYSVPLDASRRCIPCFSLTPNAAQILRQRIAVDPALSLRARVRSRRYAGTAPMLTGTVGAGEPAIYVCGHIDEIGAQDNASGCGVAIEALRVLQGLQRSKHFSHQRRAIRFFFSTEVRGQQGWAAEQIKCPELLGGVNLDMVGGDPVKESPKMVVRTGFSDHPHFAEHVLRDAARLADREVGALPEDFGNDFVSDAVPGLTQGVGHVSLQQLTGPTYHSSADTPAVLCNHALLWTGVATTAFLYQLSRMDSRDAAAIAKRIHAQALEGAQPGAQGTLCLRQAVAKLKSMGPLLQRPAMIDRATTPEELYRAGVSRRTGLWPEVQRAEKVNAQIAELEKRLARRRPVRLEGAARVLKAADNLVPLTLETGFLSFEDHVTPSARRRLKKRLDLAPGWGAPRWAWTLASRARGKQTLHEILEELAQWGVAIDPAEAVRLVEYLVDTGRMRLRPVLSQSDIVRALKAVGVRQGSIVVAHTSLSRFGYVRGGAATVIEALLKALGPQGTLAIPTHSIGILGGQPYDPRQSPARTGRIPEYFRKMRGVRRSAHPTHSVAIHGPAGNDLLKGIRADQAALAREGFWGNLYDMDGSVLLMCPPRSATIFHAGEAWAGIPQAPVVVHARDDSGRRRVHVIPNGPYHVDYFEPMIATLTRRGTMKEAPLGEATIRFSPARPMIDLSVRANRRDPLVSLGKNGRCTCSYCRLLRDGVRAQQ
jgi:aminoglycoside 3-N-acetyltransferase